MSDHPYPPPTLLFVLADDLLHSPDLIRNLLREAQAQGRQVAEFNFNTTDVIADLGSGQARIIDVLDANADATTVPTDSLLWPFDFAVSLQPRCTAFVKAEFGMRWREAVVWLSALPETSQDPERIVTAAVIQSRGNLTGLMEAVNRGRTDWRDLLVHSGLEHEGWRLSLDEILGASGP